METNLSHKQAWKSHRKQTADAIRKIRSIIQKQDLCTCSACEAGVTHEGMTAAKIFTVCFVLAVLIIVFFGKVVIQ